MNSISSIPSPVYQYKNALRLYINENYTSSASRLACPHKPETHLAQRPLEHLLNGRIVAQASRRLSLTNRRHTAQRNANVIRDPLDEHRAILPLELVHRELIIHKSDQNSAVGVDVGNDDVLQPGDGLVSGVRSYEGKETQTSLEDTLPRKIVAAVR